MTTHKEALTLALEALKQMQAQANFDCWNLNICDEAIAIAEEALAQPEQPRVRTGDCLLTGVCASEGHKIQLKEPEQEPVAWIRRHPNGALSNEILIHVQVETVRRNSGSWVPLYTTPPQRTWVGLDDIDLAGCGNQDEVSLARYWERVLREKNK